MIFLNKIFNQNCKSGIKQIPNNSIDCCVTSPPYYGLRNYGIDEQIGLEESPELYIEQLVGVFSEVRRVLKPEGTLWLNLGDSYCGSTSESKNKNYDGIISKKTMNGQDNRVGRGDRTQNIIKIGIKPKDLIGIPWMVAFALRADGWYLRQDIIWSKPNPMPESVTDRCTKSHEYIFLLSKNPKYYYNQGAIKEPASNNTHARQARAKMGQKSNPDDKKSGIRPPKAQGIPTGMIKNNESFNKALANIVDERNKRSVWVVSPEAFPEAHFATFPQMLIIDCIKAGCPEGGIVLDPFMGAGTTAVVARKLNRNYVGFELNPDYIKIANNRLVKELGLFI